MNKEGNDVSRFVIYFEPKQEASTVNISPHTHTTPKRHRSGSPSNHPSRDSIRKVIISLTIGFSGFPHTNDFTLLGKHWSH